MYSDAVAVKDTLMDAISRRPVGKASWKRMLDEIIASEREDLKDMQLLRLRLKGDSQAIDLLGILQARKSERIAQLNELHRYSAKGSEPRSNTPSATPDWLMP